MKWWQEAVKLPNLRVRRKETWVWIGGVKRLEKDEWVDPSVDEELEPKKVLVEREDAIEVG